MCKSANVRPQNIALINLILFSLVSWFTLIDCVAFLHFCLPVNGNLAIKDLFYSV